MTVQLKTPQITWSTNTASFAYPLDNWQVYSEPREGSHWIQSVSGVEDSFIVGFDYILEGDLRWIPSGSSTGQTGWNGASGVRAMLEWGQQKQTLTFYPDKNATTNYPSYLVEPMGGHTLEADGTRTVRIKLRNVSLPYDGY